MPASTRSGSLHSTRHSTSKTAESVSVPVCSTESVCNAACASASMPSFAPGAERECRNAALDAKANVSSSSRQISSTRTRPSTVTAPSLTAVLVTVTLPSAQSTSALLRPSGRGRSPSTSACDVARTTRRAAPSSLNCSSIILPPNRMAVSVHIYERPLLIMHHAGLAIPPCNLWSFLSFR